MSGGFFRGTSADQDTRFSNKQAKLLKSQKFAPELDHLVDATKVKMDVIRPWIAARATELLGFEDEVLINFVYGLLDGKAVDGKHVQIQLTGFMEKNTVKFMKELWNLLLSAQKNASGVPQQFLDAKEEEEMKKKVETDRIAQEIQKRQEKVAREPERRKEPRMGGEANISRFTDAPPDSVSKRRASSSEEEREADVRHGRRSKREGSKSRSVSVSSQSQSHSISPERHYRSPRRRSVSLSRRDRSPPRLTISPPRRYSPRSALSPSRKSRRRSDSHPRHRSPSPSRRRSPNARRRSPLRKSSPPRLSISPRRRYSPRNARSPSRKIRRRSGSHPRHRSPSPSRRRSPHARRRSPFLRHRSPSPLRRRSPSPSRHRSPIHRKSCSPTRHRSPIRRKSLSPARRMSPSPVRRRSPPPRSLKYRHSPLHSPRNHAAGLQVSPRQRKRSRSPYRSRSPLYRVRKSLSRERDSRINGVESKQYRDDHVSHRTREKRSPLHHALAREVAEHPDSGNKVLDSVSRRLPTSLRSPQRDSRDKSDIRDRVPVVTPKESPSRSLSPSHTQRTNSRKNRSLSGSPVNQTSEHLRHYDSPESSGEEEQISHAREKLHPLHKKSKDLPANNGLKKFDGSHFSPEVYSIDRSAESRSPSSRLHVVKSELRKDHEDQRYTDLAERHVQRVSPSQGVEYGPGKVKEERFSADEVHEKQQSTNEQARASSSLEEREYNEQAMKHSGVDGRRVFDKRLSHTKSDEYIDSHYEIESVSKPKTNVARSNLLETISSDSEETEACTKKQKHKKSDGHKKHADDSESDSEVDDRKMAKRRRKEDKRLHKEERRRKREERHRRKLERHASKLTEKSMDTVARPFDMENNLNGSDESDGDAATGKVSHSSDTKEPESEQKKLEIELRKKALESLRAKKAISD